MVSKLELYSRRKSLQEKILEVLSNLPDLNFWSKTEEKTLLKTSECFSFILEEMLKWKEITKNTKILDAGCGESHLSVALKKMFNADIHCIDLFEKPRERLERHGIKFYKQDFSLKPLPFKSNNFDVIIFTDVIEHLTSGQHFILREFKRVLKPGGIILISTPNILSFPKRIKFILGNSPLTPFQDLLLQDHIHEYSLEELNSFIGSAKLEIKNSKIVNTLYKYLKKNFLVKFVYKIITFVSPGMGDYIIVVATTK